MKIGIVGGGQLAQMLHRAAIGLGFGVVVLDPDERCAAASAGAARFDGTWESLDDLVAFAGSGVDVVTFDHELADPVNVARLQDVSPVPIRPAAATKLMAQDKLHARRVLTEFGVPLPAFAPVERIADVNTFAARHGWPVVLKTRRGGYDGRGVWIVAEAAEAAAVLAQTRGGSGMLVEERVDIAAEFSVMVARRPSGQIRAWPPLQTRQVAAVCTEVEVAPGSDEPGGARDLGVDIAERIELAGVMAVELFASRTGDLVVNELACRPHNSGHVTVDACVTGQFEQHLRAVLDLPLGDPSPVGPAAVMVNVLGGPAPWEADDLAAALAVDGATVHLYGKAHRPGRKLGHVNALGVTVEEARSRATQAAEALSRAYVDQSY